MNVCLDLALLQFTLSLYFSPSSLSSSRDSRAIEWVNEQTDAASFKSLYDVVLFWLYRSRSYLLFFASLIESWILSGGASAPFFLFSVSPLPSFRCLSRTKDTIPFLLWERCRRYPGHVYHFCLSALPSFLIASAMNPTQGRKTLYLLLFRKD